MSVNSLERMQNDLEKIIRDAQEKLDRVLSVKPSMDALSVALDEAFEAVHDLDMLPVLADVITTKAQSWGLNLTSRFTNALVEEIISTSEDIEAVRNAVVSTPAPSSTPTPKRAANKAENEAKAKAKSFLNYGGERLQQITARKLMLEAVEASTLIDKVSFREKLQTNDQSLFWGFVSEIVDELELLAHNKEAYDSIMPPALPPYIIDYESAMPPVNSPVVNIAPIKPAEKTEEAISWKVLAEVEALKGAVVLNNLSGVVGTVEISGFSTVTGKDATVTVRYPGGVCLSPVKHLSLVAPAATTPPDWTVPSLSKVEELVEIPKEPKEKEEKELSASDLQMFTELTTKQHPLNPDEIRSWIADPDMPEVSSIGDVYRIVMNKPALTDESEELEELEEMERISDTSIDLGLIDVDVEEEGNDWLGENDEDTIPNDELPLEEDDKDEIDF